MAVSFSSSIPQASSIFALYASLSAFIMLIQTMLNQLIPRHLQHRLLDHLLRYFQPRSDLATLVVEERDGMYTNEIFAAAETYLCTKVRPNTARLRVAKRHKDPALTVRFAQCEDIPDSFHGVHLQWRFVNVDKHKNKTHSNPMNSDVGSDMDIVGSETEKRYFELRFDKAHKDKVLDHYIPFVLEKAKSIREEKKIVKLHTLACGSPYSTSIVWDSVNLEHPSTFDTLAMEPGLKSSIVQDLDRFVRRKEFYRKVGRAWKRGYLLYGPPGTGKSSLIAAMANYLKFDIYDLELTNVKRDSDLRKLLLRTANRSILVIEDIDCTVELPDRKGKSTAGSSDAHSYRPHDQKFTLSGLLNFIDGLWSSCGDERIIIFTTNNKEKLDPALLRPGRMDMHIHMSYLTPDGFKLLASTYLNLHEDHPCMSEIEDLIKNMNVSPAEVAEELMKSDDAHTSLVGLLDFLKCKKKFFLERNKKKDKKIIKKGKGVFENGDAKAKEIMGDESDN